MNGVNAPPRGPSQPAQVPTGAYQPYPRPGRSRPIFAPRDYWFFISLVIVVGVSIFAYLFILGAWATADELECEVEVVITVTGKESYESTLVKVELAYEGSDDYQVAGRRVMANPEGIATCTFTLERRGSYTLRAYFVDDPDGPVASRGFELVSNDDGGCRNIDLVLPWSG